MKATSIEDIREHLAKGGRVVMWSTAYMPHSVWETTGNDLVHVEGFHPLEFAHPDVDHWELLPIEELPRDRGHICNELPIEDAMDPYTQRKQQLRKKVLHGYTWNPEEQREVWALLTGERIEPGKRCPRCGGEGLSWRFDDCESSMSRPKQCPKCQGSGYERQPTWMDGR